MPETVLKIEVMGKTIRFFSCQTCKKTRREENSLMSEAWEQFRCVDCAYALDGGVRPTIPAMWRKKVAIND